jgi:hypothetical protein
VSRGDGELETWNGEGKIGRLSGKRDGSVDEFTLVGRAQLILKQNACKLSVQHNTSDVDQQNSSQAFTPLVSCNRLRYLFANL